MKLAEGIGISGNVDVAWLRCHLKARRMRSKSRSDNLGSNRSISGRKVGRKHDDSIYARSQGHKIVKTFFRHLEIGRAYFLRCFHKKLHLPANFHTAALQDGGAGIFVSDEHQLYFI